MLNHQLNQFEPDYVVLPGEVLEETLGARGIKKQDFAIRCDVTSKTVSQIIGGEAPISADLALRFERVLGVSAAVWKNLESLYRLREAREVEKARLKNHLEWAKKFPLKELHCRGIVPDRKATVETVRGLLQFFGVSSVSAWETRFRTLKVAFRGSKSFKSSPESVSAWLRIGELKADEIETNVFDRDSFRMALKKIRSLTKTGPDIFEERMVRLCADSGVALTFVSELPKTRLSGATRWLTPDKALIILSLRHKSDDHFWFTFFHEAGHILLHGKKQVFVDELKQPLDEEEQEANQFAGNQLLPKASFRQFVEKGSFTASAIRAFSEELDISPGIVVGRLQHEGLIEFKNHNQLKRKFQIVDLGGND